MNETDKPPINVIIIIDKIISKPGIENGKQLLGLISLGIKLEDTDIKNFVKYSVIPIGTKTTIPVIK